MTEIKGYIRPVTSLIAMLLRGPSVPLLEVIEKAIKALQTSLGNGTLDEAVSDLEVLLVQLWTQPWLPTKDHCITDPTILYLVFSSILPSGSFKEPKLITNIIARFEYCMCLFSISQIHTHVTQDAGFEEWEPWLQEKVESTFNLLCTLQYFASSIAFGTMGPPRIYWTDCKTFYSMLYKGDPVSFDCIQAMLSDNEKMLKDVWEQELLFSLDLSVQYESIKDDLSNITPGYGFVTDHRNSCFSDSNLLLSSILNISQLKDHFIALEHKGIMVWKAHELKTWLSSYAKFHLALITRVNLTQLNSQPKGQSQSALLAESASLEEPESSQPSTLVERDSPPVQDGLEHVLHKPDANWTCSEQLEGIKAMLRLKKDVLAILPTGAGKMMLVIIPSLLEKDQITVLFDSSKHLSGSTNLVLVSADIVKTTGWKQAIAELSQCIPVVRQIFDESHIPVTSSSFRPALLNMSDIWVQFPTQIVLLSATVPKAMEPYLIHDFGFGENHFILRTWTNRPELEYHWMSPQMENHLPESISSLIKATLKLPQD
ncbi:hypothetical protein CPB84DRAFT_1855201 [Gymnopilus junonius]|uniref:Helicase ATP-binding domain-containing protein n=1 Tax=Gymnopilus junonius TaxID=109634 RepID=A0A9P5TG86_GYMJU|nr:hypothetical protein CPB84DRAFT_1855201 [Gymnopilus junonius]